MTGMQIMEAIIEILVGGITRIGSAIGLGLSNLVTSILLTGEGETQTLSTFGVVTVVFAGIALAIGLNLLVPLYGNIY